MVAPLQLAIRFLLELAALVAAGIAGASVGSPSLGLVGGIAAAVAFGVLWGLFLAPRARYPQTATFRLVVGTLVMEAAALGLVAAGSVTAGGILAAAILANAVALAAAGAATDDAGMPVR